MAEYACWVVTIYRPPVFIAASLSEVYYKVWCNLALLFWANSAPNISYKNYDFVDAFFWYFQVTFSQIPK